MKAHHFVPLVLLVLICVVGLVSGKNLLSQLGDMMMTGNKNDAKQEGNPNEKRRRLLEEKGNSGKYNVDIDAATGTVQDIVAKKEATCDGQLASALVQANDLVTVVKKERDEVLVDHKLALEKMAHLEKVLTQADRNLIEEQDARGALEIEMATALRVEKERSMKELEGLKDEKDGIIFSLKEESVRLLKQVNEQSQKEIRSLEKEKDEIITSLEAKLKMSVEELESTLSSELEKAKNDKDTKIATIEADRDAKVTKLTTEMNDAVEHLKKDRETKVAELTATIKDAVENLEHDRDTKVAELTQTMLHAAEEAAEVLRTTKDEAKAYLLKQATSIKDELAQAKVECDERLTGKNKKIKNLQEYTENMLGKKSTVERSLTEANLELAHWRYIHSNRSYCNMTHIANDMYDASGKVYSQAWETGMVIYAESRKQATVAADTAIGHVSNGLEYSSRFIIDQMDKHWPTIQPYYKEHITDNYEAHFEPHLREHVLPRLHQASVWYHKEVMPWVVQNIEDIRKLYDAQVCPLVQKLFKDVKEFHQTMIRLYGKYCRSSLEEFRNASKESESGFLKKYPPPTSFMESWKRSCAHPQESLNALMQGTLLLFTIFFHRRIIGLLRGIVTFLVSIIIRFTPLRFVFLRRGGNESPAKPTGSSSSSMSLSASVDDTNGSSKAKIEAHEDSQTSGTAKLY